MSRSLTWCSQLGLLGGRAFFVASPTTAQTLECHFSVFLVSIMLRYRNFKITKLLLLGLVASAMMPNSVFSQTPYTPSNDDQVLERLPKALLLNRDRMASIRQRLAADPSNSGLAASAALGYIRMGNEEGDPRFYGYARAAIESWWDEELPPASVLKIRAKLKEKDHQYKQAIADLAAQLDRDQSDLQSRVEIVNLYRVVGDYEAGRMSIQRLAKFEDANAILVSTTPLQAVNGHAEKAYQALTDRLGTADGESSDLAAWINSTLGDIAVSLGQFESADRHYRRSLAIESRSIHVKRTYAEFLIDQQHPRPVLQLLADHENDNGCLLLMAIAAQRMGESGIAETFKSKLATRFEEIRLRGSQPHGRFESRYELELNKDPERALEIALENWQLQKENRDARVVLESALALKNIAAAMPTIEFIKASKNEDVFLAQLIQKLERL